MCTLEVAMQTESPFHPWHCSGNNQSWLRSSAHEDPSQQWDLGKLPELCVPGRELQQAQVPQDTDIFLTLQLVQAVLVLPLGAE